MRPLQQQKYAGVETEVRSLRIEDDDDDDDDDDDEKIGDDGGGGPSLPVKASCGADDPGL